MQDLEVISETSSSGKSGQWDYTPGEAVGVIVKTETPKKLAHRMAIRTLAQRGYTCGVALVPYNQSFKNEFGHHRPLYRDSGNGQFLSERQAYLVGREFVLSVLGNFLLDQSRASA